MTMSVHVAQKLKIVRRMRIELEYLSTIAHALKLIHFIIFSCCVAAVSR